MKYFSRFFITSLITCVSIQALHAQTFALNNGFTTNQTVTTCTGTFYDSNISGNYSASENYTVTFKPSAIGRVLQFSFQEMNISNGDLLIVYDGTSTSNEVIDTFTNFATTTAFAIFASDTNSTGSLTFKFTSNASIQASGWRAIIQCGFPCKQRILGFINTSPAKDVNGYTNICLTPTGTVQFNLTATYPDNGIVYNQADSTSTFHWFFGDGKDTIAKNLVSVSHNYSQEGGYMVRLIIKDSNGCTNRVPIEVKLRTGIKPLFKISSPNTVCVNDTIKIAPSSSSTPGSGGFVSPIQGSFLTLPVSGDSLFLPDGSGVTYSSNISINQFAAGQTLANINDLRGIFINMEHSYLGDLSIAIKAPNGVTVNLKNYPGGAGTYLGEPVDEDSPTPANNALSTVAGKGYTYVFNTIPQYGTMVAESNLHNYSFVDNAGRNQSNKRYLPPGTYASANNLSALVGTPLNGTWTLLIKDNLAIDNGFLFNWKLEFNPAIFPNIETYTVPIISQTWVSPANGLTNVNGTLATIIPSTSENLNYIYRVIDGFGCTFDTTIKIQAIAAPQKPNLGLDKAFCLGQSILSLTVNNPDNVAFYTWSNGANGVATSVNVPGSFIVTANNTAGCKSRDTIVVNAPENLIVNLGADTLYCATKPNVLKPIISNNIIGLLWNDGSTADTLKINATGLYSVKGTTANGCSITDEIIVSNNPINNFTVFTDTIICEKTSFTYTINPPLNTNVLWNDGFSGNTKTLTSVNNYTITANYKGCIKQNFLHVKSKPLPVFNLGNDVLLCNSKTMLLKANYLGATYLWNDNSTDSTLLATTEKIYWAEATLNDCKFRDSITIKYEKCDCNTIVPNTFSPNGDGINDLFLPKMDCVPTQYSLIIFNRSGAPVFETKNYTASWNGTINNKPAPVGTYYYIIQYINPGLAKPERYTGSITILR